MTFRPVHLQTRVLGLDLALPFLLAPVGYSPRMHSGGEVAVNSWIPPEIPQPSAKTLEAVDKVASYHEGEGR